MTSAPKPAVVVPAKRSHSRSKNGVASLAYVRDPYAVPPVSPLTLIAFTNSERMGPCFRRDDTGIYSGCMLFGSQ